MKASAAPVDGGRSRDGAELKGDGTVAFAVVLALLAISGIVYAALRRRWVVLTGSAVVLVLVVATWAFFWFNPY